MRRLLVVAALLVALPAGALDIDWVYVGNKGNASDTASNCLNDAADCGQVLYDYDISKYEVTNAHYAEFLNAKAASDSFELFNTDPCVPLDCPPPISGITRSGEDGSYVYAVKAGFENKPVILVSFWDALRFANWLHNGQGSGDTETGAYTITAEGITNNSITRNEQALVFLPNENEWYKAAYFDGALSTYYDYPTGTDTETICVAPPADTGNSANCFIPFADGPTDVGAYALSDSPYGTFDQGGNVSEWNEEIVASDERGWRGGDWYNTSMILAAFVSPSLNPSDGPRNGGFRVARTVPEPRQVLLVLTGALALAATRWKRRHS